jgi:ligand-binding sensor domain-containing protein/two-component sensor histidine kinase
MLGRIPLLRVLAQVTVLIILLWSPGPFFIRAERLPLKTYSTSDSLVNNEINKIFRDSRGFLWLCTAGGLSRFDGYTFVNFATENGLPDPVVNDFLETRRGEYWLATNGGLVRFNPNGVPINDTTNTNRSFTDSKMFSAILTDDQNQPISAINTLLEDRQGDLWCGTTKGLYRLERSSASLTLHGIDLGMPTEYVAQSQILSLIEDINGFIWVAAPSGLYRRSHDGSTVRYTRKDGLPTDYIQTLFIDDQNRLWAGTRDSGFFEFSADYVNSRIAVIRSYNTRTGLPTGWIYELFETSDRTFWAATNEGLMQFHPGKDESIQVYTTRNGLTYHEITALAEDLSGNLWLGTSTAGAMKLARKGFQTYDEQDGIAVVNSIFEDQAGGLCFRGAVLGDNRTSVFEGAQLDLLRSTRDVYYTRFGRFDGERFSWFKPDAIPNFGWVSEQLTLQTRNGEWWVGTSDGLYHFAAAANFDHLKSARPLAIYTTKDGLATPQVFRLFEDPHGNIWISTISSAINGLARWNAATGKIEDLSKVPELPSATNHLARIFGKDAAGNTWIGYSRGVARFRQGSFSFFTGGDGLPPGAVVQIYLDHKGRFWLVSSVSGLIEVPNPDAVRPAFKRFTTTQSLPRNELTVITDDLNGCIYVGGGLGLDQIDPETGRLKRFTTADGLAPGAFLAAFRDRRGDLWFGTTRGLSHYTPATEDAAPPPVLISAVQVAGVRQHVSALGEKSLSLPALSSNQNQVQIEFVGLNFALGEVIRYQYKIEGVDPDWSAPTEQRTVNYANLAPRTYRFLVRAVNSSGRASIEPASVSFTIPPPVWRRWWFVTLAVLVVGLMIYKLFRYRVNRLVEVANIRTHIAADLHDDIGSSLSQIAVLSEVLRKQLGRQEAAVSKNISLINRVSQEALDSMSDIVWAINPQQDHLSDLVRKMRRVASEVLPARDIGFSFKAPSETPDLKLGAEIRRQVFLMFKEAINNLVRHSKCSRAEIELKIEGVSLLLKVMDNGVGFAPDAVTDGNGLVSLRRRAAALGGQTTVSSTIGQGTTVTIRVPYSSRRRAIRNGTRRTNKQPSH